MRQHWQAVTKIPRAVTEEQVRRAIERQAAIDAVLTELAAWEDWKRENVNS